jgi:hypothetical protein
VHFPGEMICPWMFDEYERLKPLKEAAEIKVVATSWRGIPRSTTTMMRWRKSIE